MFMDREGWTAFTPHGVVLDFKTIVSATGVDVEEVDGPNDASISIREDGIDIRVGDLQFVVRGKHVTVVQKLPPYPISQWTVLWEGGMA